MVPLKEFSHDTCIPGDSKNAVQVREKLSVLTETMERLEDAQAELLSLLLDEKHFCELGYTADVLCRAMDLKEGIYDWLAQYEDDGTQEEPRHRLMSWKYAPPYTTCK